MSCGFIGEEVMNWGRFRRFQVLLEFSTGRFSSQRWMIRFNGSIDQSKKKRKKRY
ncbi:hypothetical protein HanPSC8_Chr03g0116671 [Helianthus annuus]|nr:hypothetical protein HanPSC8_Chr03g0116671 [Helianthus annuus]